MAVNVTQVGSWLTLIGVHFFLLYSSPPHVSEITNRVK